MSIALGLLFILFSSIAPALSHVGFFWSLPISVVFGIGLGFTGKYSIFGFNSGTILGSIIWIAINLDSWGHIAVTLSVFQLILTTVTILAFTIGYSFNSVQINNEQK